MNLENLKGRECMIDAVASATRCVPSDTLKEIRLMQLETNKYEMLNPKMEAEHLQALLNMTGQRYFVTLHNVHSAAELEEILLQQNNVFIGLEPTRDGSSAHIAHLGQRVKGGFQSDQQFTPDDDLTTQIMEHGVLKVFVALQSV